MTGGAQAGRSPVLSCLGCGQGSPGEVEKARVLEGAKFRHRITEEVKMAESRGKEEGRGKVGERLIEF